MRIVVVFPAPFLPRSPRALPLFTEKEIPWSTSFSPNDFFRFLTSSFIQISIPPPLVDGTNSNESFDFLCLLLYIESEKLYYKAREEES